MGYAVFPSTYNSQGIKFRVPWTLAGEVQIQAAQQGIFFPSNIFLHNIDKPFEAHRMRVRLTALDDQALPLEPQPTTLDKLIRLSVVDTSKNEPLTKSPTLVSLLRESNQGSDGDWDWVMPYTLVRSEGWAVQVDSLNFSNLPQETVSIRVEIAFQGYLLVVQPASGTR